MAQVAQAKVTLSLEDKITGPIKRIRAQFDKIGESLKLNSFTNSTKKLVSSLNNVQNSLKSTTGRAAKLAAIAGIGGGSLTGIAANLTKNLSVTGDAINKVSNQLGVGSQTLQLWRAEAEKAGISASQMDGAIASLDSASRQAAGGNQEMQATFNKLGVSQRDAQGRLKSMNQLLLEVGDALSKVQGKAAKTDISKKLFGDQDITAVIAKKRADLEKSMSQTRIQKGILGQDVLDESTKFLGILDEIKNHMGNLKDVIAAQLLPIITDLAGRFRDFLGNNKQEIIKKITSAFKYLHNVMKDLMDPTSALRQRIKVLQENLEYLYSKIKPLITLVGGPLNAVIITLGVYIAGPLVAALATASSAVFSFGTALMTTPIGWIISGIAAVAGAVYLIYKNWDAFCSYWADLWNRVTRAFDQGFIQGILSLLYNFNPAKIIVDGINWLIDYLFGINLREVGTHIISSLWDGLKDKWDNVVNWLKNKIMQLTNWMPSWMKDKLGLNFKLEESATQPAKAANEAVEKTENINKTATKTTINTTNNIDKNNKINTEAPQRIQANQSEPSSEAEKQRQMDFAKASFNQEPLSSSGNKEAKIDASVSINSLTIETPNGLADEIRRVVLDVMEEFAQKQSRAISSSLSD